MAHSHLVCIPAFAGEFSVSLCAVIGVAKTEHCVEICATENAQALFPVSVSASALEEQLVPDQLGNGAGCCPPAQVELRRQSQETLRKVVHLPLSLVRAETASGGLKTIWPCASASFLALYWGGREPWD